MLYFACVSLALAMQGARADYPPAFSRDRCTTMAFGKRATAEGPIATHTADCAECDFRINKVPAQDYPEGALRPVYILSGEYPRQVREDRGETWSARNLEDMPQRAAWAEAGQREVLGHIPQARHTFALIEGLYGIMNEHQVAIGESTCAAKLFAAPVGHGGKALLEASELSQIALERCTTAREAVLLMGELAVKYGFYSAEWRTDSSYGLSLPLGEGGEALSVVDPSEAWVFHILPDPSGSSAIWVAQRVPDDHVAVVANSFVIREVHPASPDFLYSDNLFSVAEDMGWWSPSLGPLNFLKAYTPQRYHANYCHRRVWRVFSLAAPSLALPSTTGPFADDYPFSVKVDAPLSVETVMEWQRDHYEGTAFSTTEGLAGGPFGDPNRFDMGAAENLTAEEARTGEFQRTVSLFRTSYAVVAVAREVPHVLAMTWLCQYAPDMSSFMPLHVAVDRLPRPWTRGAFARYDTTSAWWNHAAAGNYASRFYKFTVPVVRALQKSLFDSLQTSLEALETRVSADPDDGDVVAAMTRFGAEQGDMVNEAWKALLPSLITRFRDGYVLTGLDTAAITITPMFYPRWWLEAVGYFDMKRNADAEIMLAPAPHLRSQCFVFSFLLVATLLLGVAIGRISVTREWSKSRELQGGRGVYGSTNI